VSAAKPARPPRSSSGSSRSQEARDRLQAEQHALQREKERLAEEAHLAERKRRQEEERLKRERAALAKEREALKAQPPKPSSATDTRSPEAVLGINSTTYTLQELKEARKREAARWHPSSMQHKPKELIDMAEEELKKINLAYDKLKKKFE
jgi:DNA repair exonuclease SbcCD ATPase subunit